MKNKLPSGFMKISAICQAKEIRVILIKPDCTVNLNVFLCIHGIQGWILCLEQLGCHSIRGLTISVSLAGHVKGV